MKSLLFILLTFSITNIVFAQTETKQNNQVQTNANTLIEGEAILIQQEQILTGQEQHAFYTLTMV